MAIPQKYKKNIFYKTFHQSRLLYFKTKVFWQANNWGFLEQIFNNPQKIIKGLKILFKKGPKKFLERINSQQQLSNINNQYKKWFKKNWPNRKILNKQKEIQKTFKYRPKISIITPVYNPNKKWLIKCINSVINQSYDNWELCLADDCSSNPKIKEILNKYKNIDSRIKIVFRKKNGHISKSSNSALKLATGEFIGLLDHDDELSPNALFEVIKALNKNKNIDFIYSDEDKIEPSGKHTDPFFKPDWSPDMLLSYNYLCHFVVIRKKIVDNLGKFRTGYEGSQDYDLFLRTTEKTNNIHHIDMILYSWRKIPNSTAAVYSNKNYCNQTSINALQEALSRRKIKGIVENGLAGGTFRIKYKIKGEPLVSIIIPTKDKVNLLKDCINSILELSTYKNYEITIVDTSSIEKKTFDYYQIIKNNPKIKVINWFKKFNYSTVNNFAAKRAKGKYLLFLNNDTKIISNDWIENMLMLAEQKHSGPIGCKLVYSDNRIQHAGIEMLDNMWPHHYETNYSDFIKDTFPSPNYKDIVKNPSAVTAACLLINKNLFFKLDGFDENFPNEFQDVLLSIKAHKYKKNPIYTPFAKIIHYESQTIKEKRTWGKIISKFIVFRKEINKNTYLSLNKNIKDINKEILVTINSIDKKIKTYNGKK